MKEREREREKKRKAIEISGTDAASATEYGTTNRTGVEQYFLFPKGKNRRLDSLPLKYPCWIALSLIAHLPV